MKILFFDGQCTLCNHWVDWLIQRDKNDILKFASLQGTTAQAQLPLEFKKNTNFDTVLYVRDGKVYDRSNAVLKAVQDLGGYWGFVGVFYIFPRFLRDAVYWLIAHYRYRIFGKTQTCRIPTKNDLKKILP